MRDRFEIFIRFLNDIERSSLTLPLFVASGRRWWVSIALGVIYAIISVFSGYIGINFVVNKVISQPYQSPLWAILRAPILETIILISLTYISRFGFKMFINWPRLYLFSTASSIFIMLGLQHTSEALNPEPLWHFIRFFETGLIFSFMMMQWEATLRQGGQTQAFISVAISHFIDNLLVYVAAKFYLGEWHV